MKITGTELRLKYYPVHKDYIEMQMDWHPFIMMINQALYRSKAVNTDKYGFREQYDPDGLFINMDNLKGSYSACNVMIGASTVFGVDVSSDKSTFSSMLSETGIPCLNFGSRGATSQQEIVLFLLFKHLLPPVHNIFIFSGVNNASMASLKGTLRDSDFGSVFNDELITPRFGEEFFNLDETITAKVRYFKYLLHRTDDRYVKSRIFRWYVRYRFSGRPLENERIPIPKDDLSFKQKMEIVNRYTRNDLQTWMCMQDGLQAKVHYILQPCLGWTRKALSRREKNIFETDLVNIPGLNLYANQEFYHGYTSFIRKACEDTRIDFYNANEWLNQSVYAGTDMFTDICHLNDNGNVIIAELIKKNISYKKEVK